MTPDIHALAREYQEASEQPGTSERGRLLRCLAVADRLAAAVLALADPDLLTMAREYQARRAAGVRRSSEDAVIEEILVRTVIGGGGAATSCPRHPGAAVRCEACVVSERQAKAASSVTPAARRARQRNAAKARKARAAKAKKRT